MKTQFSSITFFFLNRAVYEIKLKNMVQQERPQITIWNGVEKMRYACQKT